MRWTYDVNSRARYIYLSEGTPERQVELPDGSVIDVGRDGNAIGIEIFGRGVRLDSATLRRFGIPDEVVPLLDAVSLAPFPVMLGSGSLGTPEPELPADSDFFESELALAIR